MKTKKNLSHSHEVTGAANVSVYDGWRENVSITLRDDHKDGQDEVSIEMPNNVFYTLVEKLNGIVEERKAAAQELAEEVDE